MGLTTGDLRQLLAALPGLDRGVGDAERVEQLGLLESLKGACAAVQARVSVDFADSQLAVQAAAGVPARERGRGIAAQVALARRESPARGSRRLGLARAMVGELQHTYAHLAAGRISEWRATVVCRETACLSVEDRRVVDQVLGPELPHLSDAALEGQVRGLACALDNAGMAARAARAATERWVTLRPAPDTMTYLTALLPVEQGVAAFAALKAASTQRRDDADDRTADQVMSDTLVERVTGQARAGAVPVEVQLVMTPDTLLGGGDQPARVAHPDGSSPSGGDVLPAGYARDLVRRVLVEGTEVGVRRLFTAPDGRTLVAMESTARHYGGLLRRFLLTRDQRCRTPWCGAPIRHADHVVPARAGGATTAGNGRGTCAACNYAKEAPGWTAHAHPPTHSTGPVSATGPGSATRPPGPHTVTITTPTGHTYQSLEPPVLPLLSAATARRPRAPDEHAPGVPVPGVPLPENGVVTAFPEPIRIRAADAARLAELVLRGRRAA